MKLIIKHLLHYRWEGPSIGIRLKSCKWNYGVIIPISQKLSNLLIWVQNKGENNGKTRQTKDS